MQITSLSIPGVKLITPRKFDDARGFFSETWTASKLKAQGFDEAFVQDQHSLSVEKGTIRGLHCQIAPYVQGKLVRCVKGAIWDVAVDIRHGSLTYGKWVAAELSSQNWSQLWIPGGFLHGFCTLQPDTEVIYKVTSDYAKACERAVRWDDPVLALPWPVHPDEALLSEKDRLAPPFNPDDRWFTEA
jgi:dTDP-4-dehydrorhamnose 3,5-epimerase